MVYLPPDQLAGIDHVGQLASVYVNPGVWFLGFAMLTCADPCLASIPPVSTSAVVVPATAGAPSLRDACQLCFERQPQPCCTPFFLHPTGFTIDSFTLRTGPGAGSAYVYDMTANSAGIQTQG